LVPFLPRLIWLPLSPPLPPSLPLPLSPPLRVWKHATAGEAARVSPFRQWRHIELKCIGKATSALRSRLRSEWHSCNPPWMRGTS
jgi:hypothetical protein